MGYRKQKTIYKLVFADPEYDGLTVRAYAPTLQKFFALSELDVAAKTDRNAATELFSFFTDYLVDWNLEHQDHKEDCHEVENCDCPWVDTPPTVEGLQTQDLSFVSMIITTWMQTIASVPVPKGPQSNGGLPSQEASIPMEALSQSHAS